MAQESGTASLVRGIAWMVAASLFYASASGAVRYLSPDYPTLELVFFRNAVGFVVLLPLVARIGRPALATRRLGMQTTRMLFSWVGTLALFYALADLPIADVGALIFTQPLLTIMLAMLVLRQPASARNWAACMVGFAGALAILRPGFVEVSAGALLALFAAFTYACASTAIKSLSRTDSTAAITFYMNLLMLPFTAVPALFVWKAPALGDAPALFLMGFLYICAQYSIAMAIASADARVVQPFDFLRLPFSAAVGYLMFRELPDAWTWAGAAIIFAASYYVLQLEARGRALR